MAMRSLPQEILDRITDEAADESLKSLKKLSLTSRCFLQRCRFHIFSRHLISHFISDKAHRILKHNPSLFENVRKVHISSEADQTQAIYLGHCKDAFARIFASHKLVNIEIDGFNDFPVHLLHSAPSLQSLSIGRILSFAEYRHQDLQPKASWHLTSLEARNEGLTEIHHLLKSCASSIYANLVNLQFTITTVQAHRNSMQIISNAAEFSILEMLDLGYTGRAEVHRCYDELITSGLTIPSFSFLHYVRLWIDLDDNHPSFLVPDLAANMIARMLCTNPQPSLTVTDVGFKWETPPIGPDFEREQAFMDAKRGWGRIDDAFSDVTRFPKLCAIGMTPSYYFPYPSSELLSDEDWEIIRSGTKAANMAAFSQTRAREGMIFGFESDSPFAEVYKRIFSERHEAHYACWRV
ncbi:hypothetical protein DFP72DRAFT_1163607 [Ephemerocybe angulata]|uniref:F-box domain-containing protein n=1 Tax=Ephemerocybe angulata TaxID=980116 RepID=A0A8H6IEP8_9AGAR|nr:hypothetical protein DFP72DRAFT_1163607 [Tulosesus angulatus]